MNTVFKLTLGAVSLSAAQWAAAASLAIAGTLSVTDPTYNRVLTGEPPPEASLIGSAVYYDVFDFYVDAAATYQLETLSAAFTVGTTDDTFITLYTSAFNPTTPLFGALAADDDAGAGGLSLLNVELSPFTAYKLVVTSFANGQIGSYTGIIAANTVGNVFAGAPVPEPGSWALLAAGLASLALRRSCAGRSAG